MHKRLTILLFLLLPVFAQAQNLVQNGNFENYSTCPIGVSQLTLASPWRSYHTGTSDFFHTCAQQPTFVSVPLNHGGYQQPANGNGYAGICSFNYHFSIPSYTEYLAAPISPMVIGKPYEVSMSVNLSNSSAYGNNGLGVWFYDNGATSTLSSVSSILSSSPQVSYTTYGVLTDTQNWIRIVSYFVPDSSYDNIVVGTFLPQSGLSTTYIQGNTYSGSSYYYIDSIVVKITPGILNLNNDSLLCAGETFYVPYNFLPGLFFNSNNVFSVQLSNASGSFASGTSIVGSVATNTAGSVTCVVPNGIIGSSGYRLRILSSSQIDSSASSIRTISIGDFTPSKPIASNNGPLCSGDTMKLSSPLGTNTQYYKWTGPENFSCNTKDTSVKNIQPLASGQYIITALNYGCKTSDTTSVLVNQKPLPFYLAYSNPICELGTINIQCTTGSPGAQYIWNGPSSFTDTTQHLLRYNASLSMAGLYTITATLGTFCVQNNSVNIVVLPVAPNFTVTANTPVCENDTLTIKASSSNPNVSYSWTAPITISDTGVTISKAPLNASGRYIVYATLNTCTIKDSIDILVNPIPANFSASYNTPLCAGDSLSLLANTNSAGVVFHWNGPNNFTDTVKYPFINNAQTYHSGKYILTAVLGNCSLTDSTTVIIKPSPDKPIANSDTVLCEGEVLHLSANSITTNAGYTWIGPDNFTSHQISTTINGVTLKASGVYIITADEDGCIQRDTASVLVKPLPEMPVINANSPLQTGQDLYLNLDNPQANVKYRWTGPHGFTSVVPNPVIYKPDTNSIGTYFLIAELNGCYNSNQLLVQIDQRADTGNLFLYPNPNNGDFFIRGVFKTDQQTPMHIFDGAGKLVYTNSFKTNNKKLFEPISLKDYLASGEYSLHIIIDGKKKILRFTVIR